MPIGVYKRKPNQKNDAEFYCWKGMIDRCTYPAHVSYHRYGGRGIKVCQRWLHYPNFKQDMGKRPSRDHQIDRIDNDGDYCPSNCRWATKVQQARNASSNRKVFFHGTYYCVSELAQLIGIPAPTLYTRISKGWDVKYILNPPKHTLTFNGVCKTWSQWSNDLDIPYNTILKRVKCGKPIDVVLENGTPRTHRIKGASN